MICSQGNAVRGDRTAESVFRFASFALFCLSSHLCMDVHKGNPESKWQMILSILLQNDYVRWFVALRACFGPKMELYNK